MLLQTITYWIDGVDLNMIDNGFIGKALSYETSNSFIQLFNEFLTSCSPYISSAAKTIMTGVLIFVCIRLQTKGKPDSERIQVNPARLLYWVYAVMIFSILFVVLSIIEYFDMCLI